MICLYCNKEFTPKNTKKIRKFCGRSCACAHRNSTTSIKDIWKKKYGDSWIERYDAWRAKMSSVTSGEKNAMFGQHDHVHGLKRYAKDRTGKSLEEVHGVTLASEIRANRSLNAKGENNPSYGRVYDNGGKSVKGHYKGKFFRSLLEYSFMKYLESNNIDLQQDVDYECFQAKFIFEGRERTYRPDFYVKSQNVVYEVKPSYVLKKAPELQVAKWNAMRELLTFRGIKFQIVTEIDFPKIAFDVARQDLDVVWKEETFKYFKGTK